MTASSTDSGSWSIGRVIAWAADDFKRRDLESPRLEAEILLCAVLGLDRVRLIVDTNRPLSTDELSTYRAMIQRRRSGEPTAYIIGHREFHGRDFHVDRRVLIPRPDTEILLEEALEKTAHRHLDGRALDLCTGSGCVAISFALARPTWRVTGTDLSEDALTVARRNALRHGALWGVRFVQGDLFSAIAPGERFEMVIANPPYIPSEELGSLDVTVRDFEPSSALDGGKNGLDFYPRLTTGARKHLVPGGMLAVEVGAGQAADVQAIFERDGFTDVIRRKDYGGHERVVSGRAPRS